jgi:hypothetical protein
VVPRLLSLDLVPALLERLVLLTPPQQEASSAAGGSSQSSQGASGAAGGGSQSSTHSPEIHHSQPNPVGEDPATYNALRGICSIVATVMTTLRVIWEHVATGGKTAAGDDDLVLVTLEQLLSSPAALKVAVHKGLSTEVQEAAGAGSVEALTCMRAVCACLQRAAFSLHMHTCATGPERGRRAKALSRQLASFLQAEENLPFLEALCLPHDGEPRKRTVLRWVLGAECCAVT